MCYDISDSKRLAKIYKKMQGFGDPIQYSVFKCDLSPGEKVILVSTLNDLIHNKEDRIMIINVGSVNGSTEKVFEFMGKTIEFTIPTAKII